MTFTGRLQGWYGSGRCAGHIFCCHHPRKQMIQYAAAPRFIISASGILGRPVKPGDDGYLVDRAS
jgi:hypothetical protein